MSLLYTAYVFAGLNKWNIIYHCLLGFQIQGWAQLKDLGKAGDRPRAAYYDFSCLFPWCQLDRVAVKIRKKHNWSCDGWADFSRIFVEHCLVSLLYLPIKFKELLKFQFIKSCNNLTLNLFIFPRGSDSAHKSKPCQECGFRISSCYYFVGIIMLMTGNFPLHVNAHTATAHGWMGYCISMRLLIIMLYYSSKYWIKFHTRPFSIQQRTEPLTRTLL